MMSFNTTDPITLARREMARQKGLASRARREAFCAQFATEAELMAALFKIELFGPNVTQRLDVWTSPGGSQTRPPVQSVSHGHASGPRRCGGSEDVVMTICVPTIVVTEVPYVREGEPSGPERLGGSQFLRAPKELSPWRRKVADWRQEDQEAKQEAERKVLREQAAANERAQKEKERVEEQQRAWAEKKRLEEQERARAQRVKEAGPNAFQKMAEKRKMRPLPKRAQSGRAQSGKSRPVYSQPMHAVYTKPLYSSFHGVAMGLQETLGRVTIGA